MSNYSMPCAANAWPLELRLSIADAMFNNSSEGICITDAHERIVDVNPTLCQLSGYSRSELLGTTSRLFLSDLQSPEFYTALHNLLEATGQWSGELWNRHSTGRLYACRMNISAIHNKQGELTHYLYIEADITAAKIYLEHLEKNANHDDLTTLPNRLGLMDRLNQAMAHSRRSGLMLAICYLDLDGFKVINDSYGHRVGDQALVEVARRMASSVREVDTVARVGGDEFVILLWGIKDRAECDQTLSRIVSEIADITELGAFDVSLRVSVGVTLFPEDGEDVLVLLAQADSAMYRSKVEGGSDWRYFKAQEMLA